MDDPAAGPWGEPRRSILDQFGELAFAFALDLLRGIVMGVGMFAAVAVLVALLKPR